jgi:hypothetical protein
MTKPGYSQILLSDRAKNALDAARVSIPGVERKESYTEAILRILSGIDTNKSDPQEMIRTYERDRKRAYRSRVKRERGLSGGEGEN